MKVSVIIPAYNEEKVIKDSLESLAKQTYEQSSRASRTRDLEIIVVDDGSTDKTVEKVHGVQLLKQTHGGPGEARNLGAKKAKGEILVFVDADMTFDKNFIKELVDPIIDGKTIGTFSKEEYVLNKDSVWSKCWNINKKLPFDRMHPKDYSNTQPVFRAILKKEFDRVGGFSPIGYIDDYTLSEKLGVLATVVHGAKFYHKNPDNLIEVFIQARWVGKSEYKKRKIKNENLMRVFAIVRYSLFFSLIHGTFGAIKYGLPKYFIFKIIYDLAVEISLINSFFREQPNK